MRRRPISNSGVGCGNRKASRSSGAFSARRRRQQRRTVIGFHDSRSLPPSVAERFQHRQWRAFQSAGREQHRILLAKMREFTSSEDRRCILGRKPHQAAILSTNWVGLAAIQQVFGESGAVILEESEKERWLADVCPVNHEAFWWYAFAWWTLKEGLTGEDEARIRQHFPIPEGCSYWVVVSGVQWGGLAGGANHEHVEVGRLALTSSKCTASIPIQRCVCRPTLTAGDIL